ncbi:MAG: DeoR/GlpR family DNA-binding transcription regulator [Actinomycetota bacterium]|nr:DeoR/GlpR family DNA-binding transcription regulator [Actinomycetota bacterium]
MSELDRTGRVLVAELSDRFGVSSVTIRKDLDALERRSMLRRVRGGAVSAGETDEGAFEMRMRYAVPAKKAIAAAAGPMVMHGDVIALDSSTTCFYLAKELLDRRNLVVVTNGLRTAELFLAQSTAMVLMPGGVLRRSAESMVGPIGDVLSGRGRIDKGFFGVMGVSAEHGLLDLVVEEAQTKRFLAQACHRVYGLFDSSKVGKFGLHSFAATDSIEALYTDDGIDSEVVRQWAALGVPIRTTPVTGDVLELPTSARGGRAPHRRIGQNR